MVSLLVLGTVVVLTICNSLAAKFAIGGHALNIVFFGCINCLITGINLALIPPVAGGVLAP